MLEECKDSKYCNQPAPHIVTWELKIISDSRIRSIICKGPKYRFPLVIEKKLLTLHKKVMESMLKTIL